MRENESLRGIIDHPNDFISLLRLKNLAARLENDVPQEPNLAFCYRMLTKVSRSFALVIHLLPIYLRNPVCIFYLTVRAIDTIEDDSSISPDVKVPMLQSFHRHMYDKNWNFSCGTKDYKVLMENFNLVSTAFLELDKSFQGIIEDVIRSMGEGMAKFISKEVDTLEDYDEYCYYVAGIIGLGIKNLMGSSGLEDLTPIPRHELWGLFLQKTNIIRDYLEDINETPKSRMLWPKQIWRKHAYKLEDFKREGNSASALQCLNEMVTNALMHGEDCLKYLSNFHEPTTFRFWAIPQIMALGTLTLCYNNIEVFRGAVKMRRGLTAQIFHKTRSMSDVCSLFYDFSNILKEKVEKNDPNAELTLKYIENIQKACISSGMLKKWRYYGFESRRFYMAIIILLLTLAPILIGCFIKK